MNQETPKELEKNRIVNAQLIDGALRILDADGNYCDMPIRRTAFGILWEYFETATFVNPRPNIYDITRNLLLEEEPEEVFISKEIEGEYFAKVIGGDELSIRPSDAIILFLNTNVPIFIAKDLLKIEKKVEKTLEQQYKEAIEKEEYLLAAELKKKIDEEKKE